MGQRCSFWSVPTAGDPPLVPTARHRLPAHVQCTRCQSTTSMFGRDLFTEMYSFWFRSRLLPAPGPPHKPALPAKTVNIIASSVKSNARLLNSVMY